MSGFKGGGANIQQWLSSLRRHKLKVWTQAGTCGYLTVKMEIDAAVLLLTRYHFSIEGNYSHTIDDLVNLEWRLIVGIYFIRQAPEKQSHI